MPGGEVFKKNPFDVSDVEADRAAEKNTAGSKKEISDDRTEMHRLLSELHDDQDSFELLPAQDRVHEVQEEDIEFIDQDDAELEAIKSQIATRAQKTQIPASRKLPPPPPPAAFRAPLAPVVPLAAARAKKQPPAKPKTTPIVPKRAANS